MKLLVCVNQIPGSNNVEVDPVTGVRPDHRTSGERLAEPLLHYGVDKVFCL